MEYKLASINTFIKREYPVFHFHFLKTKISFRSPFLSDSNTLTYSTYITAIMNMSIHKRCTKAIDLALAELAVIERSVVALECQWKRLRDDPNRVSTDRETQMIYVQSLNKWYTIDILNERAVVTARLTAFWDKGSGKAWRKVATEMLPTLVGETMRGLRPKIDQCNEEWASLDARCNAAGEVWEELEQLELEHSNHVYFVGEHQGRLRR